MYQKGENIGFESMDGIWADYKDHVWYFFIKDRIWQGEERQNATHNALSISFFTKGCVDGFLLEIDDCLETSDIPVCVKDAEDDFFDVLNEEKDESWAVVLVNEDGTVAAVRTHAFSHDNSILLKQLLSKRRDEGYTSEHFDAAYDRILSVYEPYQLEQFVQFVQKDGRR